MRVSLNKDKCSAIDAAFKTLLETPRTEEVIKASSSIIKDTLEKSFEGYTFDVNVLKNEVNDTGIFIMSVFPETSTIDKIVSAILANKEDEVIKKLWTTNKKWTIEIDENLFTSTLFNLTEKELTAILLHEVGHVVYSNSLPIRISTVFRYEITKNSFITKALIRSDKIFRSILSLPILDACVADGKKNLINIKEEIKADSFVKKVGYSKELESALTKFINCKKIRTDAGMKDKISNSTDFSMKTIEDFRLRKDKLAKNNLLALRKECTSNYIINVIDEFVTLVFEDTGSFGEGQKLEYMHERAEKSIEGDYVTEFFLFGGKQLKRIDPNDLDYIDIKISGIKNESDKMMVCSYINSKLDLVDYYISILENPKLSKKYSIPHTLNNLYDMKKRLMTSRENALKFKIPARNKNILVAWPTGYEG